MPIDATPLLHEVVAVATKFTGEVTVDPLDGLVTYTPVVDPPLTVIVTGVVEELPQLSHS
jgi:hypothetical protein